MQPRQKTPPSAPAHLMVCKFWYAAVFLRCDGDVNAAPWPGLLSECGLLPYIRRKRGRNGVQGGGHLAQNNVEGGMCALGCSFAN